ncbi:hypothetical protein [Sunxiuqinia sp. sy24]|uniref:hypothetical protein n=1 Tax=Sunxiuqinia sp. sy24 TaxID=3461495 RepID=UPI004045232D
MIQTSKHIGALFMWIAMLVIIGHSVIPHHHHSEKLSCEQECSHETKVTANEHILFADYSQTIALCQSGHQHENCQGCHFTTVATTSISKLVLNHSYLASIVLLIYLFPEDQQTHYDSWSNQYSFCFFTLTASRGPPMLG